MRVKLKKGKLGKKYCPNCFREVDKEKEKGEVRYICDNCDLVL